MSTLYASAPSTTFMSIWAACAKSEGTCGSTDCVRPIYRVPVAMGVAVPVAMEVTVAVEVTLAVTLPGREHIAENQG